MIIIWFCFINDLKNSKNLLLEQWKQKRKKRLCIKLFNILLSIYFNDYNNTTNEEKEKMSKKYNPNNLLIKGFKFIYSVKEDEEKSKSKPGETIAERVRLRRQRADYKHLSDTSTLFSDENYDEFVYTPDMPPLEGDEVKEEKGLKILTPN